MIINRFEIITINFPFSDLSRAKQRPVTVLSEPDKNGDFICLAVTSNPDHVDSVLILNDDLQVGKLPKTSYVRTDKVFTLHISMIQHQVGRLNENKSQEVLSSCCAKIGCSS